MMAKKRYWLIALAIVAVAALGLFVLQRIEQFLIQDPRFVLAASDPGDDNPNFRIEGLTRASRSHVLQVFSADFGRSVYLMPLAERRRNLLAVDWVRDASVGRIWPNRITVRISERQPVAFVKLPTGEGTARYALIDADGVLLEPQPGARYRLPVLTGIQPEHSEPVRHERVRRMLRLLRELGPLGDQLSEIDVSDPDNLKVTQQMRNRAVVLVVGNQRFLPRLQNFLHHYEEIRRRLPDATTLDLRLEDRITAIQGAHGEQ